MSVLRRPRSGSSTRGSAGGRAGAASSSTRRTPVNFTMVAPVVRAMERDPRVELLLHRERGARPARRDLSRGARTSARFIPRRAAFMKFDAYVASDFMWASLPRGTRRVQVFHGVGGKYGFDAPTRSMREWHRLFFVNERRLRNFIAAGAIDADSPAIRLIGMPKADCLVDGSLDRAGDVLRGARPRPVAADRALRADVVAGLVAQRDGRRRWSTRLARMPINVIVKLHDRSRDLRERYSGGVDWAAALQPHAAGRARGRSRRHTTSRRTSSPPT